MKNLVQTTVSVFSGKPANTLLFANLITNINKRTMKRNILLCIFALFTTLSCSAKKVDNSTVDNLDLQRYLGKWYEIARYDHRFERGIYFPVANYSMNKDGSVRVENTGIKNGKPRISIGRAKKTDIAGLLRVSFFEPFYSDYRVLMLTEDYKHALVGSGSSKYLWILSRDTAIPMQIKYQLLTEACRRGYDVNGLIWMDQQIDYENADNWTAER